jgi:hypothetical protein
MVIHGLLLFEFIQFRAKLLLRASSNRGCRLLEAVSAAKLLAEAFHAAGGVDELLLAGEERMALIADIDVNPAAGAAGGKGVAASAVNGTGLITGMDFFFHDTTPVIPQRA